jgi:aspartyl-tRNA(Asn)/glutamyl-tRNA(Gln) amidotransferase subunit C
LGRGSKISLSTVKHLAWLTRIDLTDKEAREISRQLSRILDYFSKIDRVETKGVEPLYHAVEIQRVTRSDEPRPFPAEEILKAAPSKKGRYIKAPKIV